MQDTIERNFIWIIVLFACFALLYPNLFISLKGIIPLGLGLIMFGIGINTSMSCFKNQLETPNKILGLIIFRYMIMPLCALCISYALGLTQAESIGLLVLGTAPGGTAANVMAYLSKSNVALAVLLTFGTTLLSPIITPILIYLLLHKTVTIHFWPMVLHIGNIILIPITAGLLLNYFKIPFIQKLKLGLPMLSIVLVAIIIAIIFAINQQTLLTLPTKAICAVLILNLLGYCIGVLIATLMKQDKSNILSVAFDYGMFDAVVAIVICTSFFSKEAAIPAVLISVLQNLTAPIIVRYQNKSSQLRILSPQ